MTRFWNWPTYQYFGGAQQKALNQGGDAKPPAIGREGPGQGAVGPISDRGRGRK